MMTTATKQLHIDAIQTVTPATAVKPGQCRRISLPRPLKRRPMLESHEQIVFYYKKASEGETALAVASWLKESLSAALPEEPVLAGRLRKEQEEEGCWEIKYNDAGVRLVQATAEMTVEELLESGDGVAKEDVLAFWVDVKHEDPQFWPLMYVQVTEFQGEGYAIGISYSILLADAVLMIRFLKTWAAIHNKMQTQGRFSSEPNIFHLSHFKNLCYSPKLSSTPMLNCTSNTTTTTTKTTLFKAPISSNLSALAHEVLQGEEGVSEASLFVNDHARNHLKIETCELRLGSDVLHGGIRGVNWNELGAMEIAFVHGNKSLRVTHRVVLGGEGGGGDGGVVVVVLPAEGSSSEMMVSATVSKY